MNNSDDKIVKTKYHHDLIAEISKIKTELPSLSKDSKGLIDKKEGSKASFTAGQALMR